MNKNDHSRLGIVSIILGLFGLFFYFIGWFFFSFVDNRVYGIAIGLILGIFALILGHIAKKQNDIYGSYGMILGSIVVIIFLITTTLTIPTSVEIGYY